MKLHKRLAAYFVTLYAKREFKKAINLANSWYVATGRRHYIICDPRDESKLVAIDTQGFLDNRHALGIRSKDCTIAYLRNTCWYYTPSHGKDQIPPRDLLVRKYAFIRECLKRAKLLEEK